jgi:hypothetical protein
MQKAISLLTIILFIAIACNDDDALPKLSVNADICAPIEAGFAANIDSIISGNCAIPECHNSDGAGGIFLRNYEEIMKEANTGKFVKAIRHEKGAVPMPDKAQKLSDETIRIIECWIFNKFPE